MSKKILSVFIDESGDFGPYEPHSPYYFVSMILHNQKINLSENIKHFNSHLLNLGYPNHVIHTGPLIRRESIYSNFLIEERKCLFNALFNFARKLDFQYTILKVRKSECLDTTSLIHQLSNKLVAFLHTYRDFWYDFNIIIVYYDNGQTELTKILISAFHTLGIPIEFRKVIPANYKLFQIADLICTLELLAMKAENKSFSASELHFFDNIRNFKKNYLKHIRKKML